RFAAQRFSYSKRERQLRSPGETRRSLVSKAEELPEELGLYPLTLVCTHAFPLNPRGRGKRHRAKVRDTGCGAHVNAGVVRRGRSFQVIVTPSGFHNHPRNERLYGYYCENRKVSEKEVLDGARTLWKAGARPRGLHKYLRELTGTIRRIQVYNLIPRWKYDDKDGKTDEQKALQHRTITFQTAGMRRLFAVFPQVSLVDSTHATNSNRYKLFSFVIEDIFGKGQYVQYALIDREAKENMTDAVKSFKENNPTSKDLPKQPRKQRNGSDRRESNMSGKSHATLQMGNSTMRASTTWMCSFSIATSSPSVPGCPGGSSSNAEVPTD
ncbi:TPA: hypothetical protein N0F65_000903, partial [Lagenidium giganteum]